MAALLGLNFALVPVMYASVSTTRPVIVGLGIFRLGICLLGIFLLGSTGATNQWRWWRCPHVCSLALLNRSRTA